MQLSFQDHQKRYAIAEIALMRQRKLLVCLSALSFLMIAAGLSTISLAGISMGYVDKAIAQSVASQMKLKNGSLLFNQWSAPEIDLYHDYYFFNWTNPGEFIYGQKPSFVAVGPYKFREVRVKEDITHSEDECLVTYRQRKYYTFDQEATGSKLSENDVIVSLNLPLVAAAEKTSSFFGESVLDGLIYLTGSKLYKKLKVKELIWGYSDSFIRRLQNLGFYSASSFSIHSTSNSSMKLSTVHTGVCIPSKIGQYQVWEGNSSLTIWRDDYANMINGTEGLVFQPLVEEKDILQIFVDEMIRPLSIKFRGDKPSHKGIKTYRFAIPASELENSTMNPENARFYQNGPSGLFFLGNSTDPKGLGIYASLPHFLYGDHCLITNVSGLNPQEDLHMSYGDIEPITGATLATHSRLQVNYLLKQNSVTYFRRIPDITYFPLFYIDVTGEVSDAMATDFRRKLDLVDTAKSISWAGMISGFALFVAGLTGIFCLCMKWRSHLQSPKPGYITLGRD
ncbi:Lysosome membrane protein 2-like [Oopsacas minuta]|uniref:Lysosome membrane protein 2-like n=1 Tax=Oopsacas minuta TaxID=111878 RepID=A0AAV7JQ50_9METZ|nr:Lysosome membrane protein 2-like [Oopsacas minuta]